MYVCIFIYWELGWVHPQKTIDIWCMCVSIYVYNHARLYVCKYVSLKAGLKITMIYSLVIKPNDKVYNLYRMNVLI